MKKLLCVLTALVVTISVCACGKKNENEVPELPKNEVTEVADKAIKITVDDTKKIEEVSKDVEKIKTLVEEKATEMKQENKAVYENRQVAVAIMEEALIEMEEASKENDSEKMEEATKMFKIAQSLWDYDDTKPKQ